MSDSMITKKALAYSLKNMIKKKSFDRITISDIVNDCGLNRQTFYYHFKDKYDLLNWIYYNEAIAVFKDGLAFDNWNQKVCALLSRMKEEEDFYCTTLKKVHDSEFRNYLFSSVNSLFKDIIEHLAADFEDNAFKKDFAAEFISYGVVGMIVAWAQRGMEQSPEIIARSIKEILRDARIVATSNYFQELAEK